MKEKRIFICADGAGRFKKSLESKGYEFSPDVESCDELWLVEETITSSMQKAIMKAYSLEKPVRNIARKVA